MQVAQRVPEGHVTIVANSFVIRDVIPNHPDFMYSTNLWDVALRKGWWDPSQGLLNFLKTYAPQRYHPAYSNLRVWRILSMAAPDRNLPAETNEYADDYPFSIAVTRPEGRFSPRDVMWMNRDHFEDTPYSTAEGMAAGPYGDPNRFDLWSNGNMTVWDANEGEFPRTISLFRTSYSFVTEARSDLPKHFNKVWFAEYAPDNSVFVPMYVEATELPKSWIIGTMQKYDPTSAWWNFCAVGNYAARFYKYAMQPVRKLQDSLEGKFTAETAALQQTLMAQPEDSAVQALTKYTVDSGEAVTTRWRDLFPEMLTTYRDGFIIGGQHNTTVTITRMFYPRWWLETVGFFDHPANKNGIFFAPNPALVATTQTAQQSVLMLLVALCCFAVGWFVGRKGKSNRHNYSAIPEQEL
ncbi:hypothetical protein EON64_06015 [archaeon]|nr:MAG: hypothetical protein EON64_06015 [archaeon]